MEASRMPQGILEAYRHQNLAMHGKDGTSATFGMNIKNKMRQRYRYGDRK